MDTTSADLLSGWIAIGKHLGMKPDAARHLARTSGLPTFKLGKTVCARRSTLNAWLAEREAAGRTAPEART
ncbi:DNA-binding protein [Chelatococcus reniformis]|uniref:Uncharacterized protein n=1 Tax=Chelatococcus reniformis TaxID=1494448 RepID=A0A916UFF2_9HYPH|nr:DNA-binding protein [Chelatococcus reniformis]GGC70755.1 hypothetical protein GCM10010994_31640 [Chelatococcus reniformis]